MRGAWAAAFGPSRQSGSTARDQYAPVAIPHHCTAPTPTSHRRRQRAGQRQPSTPPSTAKAKITQCDITVSVAPAVTKTTVAALTQPPFPFQSENSDQTPALNLHSLTPPPVRTPPAVSSLEAFRTPASVHPLAPAPGRHPKTLNDFRRSRDPHQSSGSTKPNPGGGEQNAGVAPFEKCPSSGFFRQSLILRSW
jgi:hypothetical protein